MSQNVFSRKAHGLTFTAYPGYGFISAPQLIGKIVLVRAGNIIVDTDLHTICARHTAIVSEHVQNLYTPIKLLAIIFFKINALNILDILAVNTLRVSV